LISRVEVFEYLTPLFVAEWLLLLVVHVQVVSVCLDDVLAVFKNAVRLEVLVFAEV
jgi:hypothetical protein